MKSRFNLEGPAHWNFRLVKYRDGSGYGIHEVFYDEEGEPFDMSEEATTFQISPPEDGAYLVQVMSMALKDCLCQPVFEEPETWPGTAPEDYERQVIN